jgi:hypothetical protein
VFERLPEIELYSLQHDGIQVPQTAWEFARQLELVGSTSTYPALPALPALPAFPAFPAFPTTPTKWWVCKQGTRLEGGLQVRLQPNA